MRYLMMSLLLGMIFSGGTVSAQEPPDVQCQTLANQFSKNPDALGIQALERLRFCVNQALEYREQNLKGELLKGTIIESQSPSEDASDRQPSTTPKNLRIQ